MRHAKSSWDDPDLPDVERPLNPRGRRDAPRMGKFLSKQALVPDQIVTSSAVRARSTAEMVADECDCTDCLTLADHLYHASVDEWNETIAAFPSEWNRVLCVGHNPGLEDFLVTLTGQYLRMPTAAIAHLTCDVAQWDEFVRSSDIVVHDVWRPKELK